MISQGTIKEPKEVWKRKEKRQDPGEEVKRRSCAEQLHHKLLINHTVLRWHQGDMFS